MLLASLMSMVLAGSNSKATVAKKKPEKEEATDPEVEMKI
eukprot:CAMPEP_0115033624 /NCGR_PEP_ID=MMETSP0216-20121206/40058_1 /TAXON_ID=223996 /ORGANISM="Protocruzia adherens, Strain Boccale" /LENGTH=39 /DNA_ID= /DNA_START= /DNA_END= /DNA_ORIENTATION=